MGVAYGHEHPKHGPLAGRDFHGGEHTVQKYLEKLGFELVINSRQRNSKEQELEDWGKSEEQPQLTNLASNNQRNDKLAA